MGVFPSIVAEEFGSKYFGVDYGIMFTGYSIAAFSARVLRLRSEQITMETFQGYLYCDCGLSGRDCNVTRCQESVETIRSPCVEKGGIAGRRGGLFDQDGHWKLLRVTRWTAHGFLSERALSILLMYCLSSFASDSNSAAAFVSPSCSASLANCVYRSMW
jgi:hypothetical protein